MRITVSPATAPAAALAKLQGASRETQPLLAVPLGATYQVTAPAGDVNASQASSDEARTFALFTARQA